LNYLLILEDCLFSDLVIFKHFTESERMNKKIFIRYYCLFNNQTSAATVSTNHFYSVKTGPSRTVLNTCSISSQILRLPAINALLYWYSDKAQSMEMAKEELSGSSAGTDLPVTMQRNANR
jgi:hypothetical protein